MGKISIVAAGLLWALAPVAWAQNADGPSGAVSARLYQPVPTGTAIAVVKADDTDQYERLKATIENALRARGYRVADDAPLTLEFYGSEVLGDQAVSRRPTGALSEKSLAPVPQRNENMGILTNLNQNLFGDDQAVANTPTGKPPQRQVSLSMTLTDKRTTRRIWQGSAMGDERRGDSFASTQSLVPFLVGNIGRTLADQKFDMP